MNYPVWSVPFGSQWLIIIVGVIHVFLAQFAVGGGFLLVAAESWAHRHEDQALLDWLKRQARVFAFITLVFGATTGVGIWFTIGLISPQATSDLIHLFVWVWAIEWVFFLVEILSVIVYARTWGRLPRRTHRIIGWIYFGSAFLSMVAIDGILAFQLAPGAWPNNRSLASAFFNPNLLPSLVVRCLLCLMLGGLWALASASFSRDRILRAEVARFASGWVWIPALLMGPACFWFAQMLPRANRKLWDFTPSMQNQTWSLAACLGLLAFLGFAVLWFRPKNLSKGLALLMLLVGLAVVGLFEWQREQLRDPYLVTGRVYSSGISVEDYPLLKQRGLLASARWLPPHLGEAKGAVAEGRDLFRVACSSCHAVTRGLNALAPAIRGMDQPYLAALVLRTDLIWPGMPPFPGKAPDARAIAAYLAARAGQAPAPSGGAAIWRMRCGVCHTLNGPFRPVLPTVKGMGPKDISDLIASIEVMNSAMPHWSGTDAERESLASYLAAQEGAKP